MIKLLFNSSYPVDRHLAALANYMDADIAVQNVMLEHPDVATIHQLSNKLRVPVASLVNMAHPYFHYNYSASGLHRLDWAELLVRRPALLKTPIGERTNQAFFIRTPTQLEKLVML